MSDPQGKKIASFENVYGWGGFSEGYLAIVVWPEIGEECNPEIYPPVWYLVDKEGNVCEKNNPTIGGIETCFTYFSSALEGGYFVANTSPMWNGSMLVKQDLSSYYLVTTGARVEEHYGTLYTFQANYLSGGTLLYYLSDATTNELLTSQGYNYIGLNADEAYFLVSRDNRWGYLSRDGKNERMYVDAGDFYDGKAIVLQDNSEIVVIDDSFQPISQPLTGYDVVGTVGENLFRVEKYGQAYLAVYQP